MLRRVQDLTYKAWIYLVKALERPRELPVIFWLTVIKRVHFGELLKLNSHKAWLKTVGIRTVIDVGAHKGQFASGIRAIFPEAQIYSFEPLQDCHQILLKRLGKYGNFKAFCVALGNQRGKVPFWRSSFSKSSSVLPMRDLHKKIFPWSEKSIPCTVQMQKLDDYVDKMYLAPSVLLKIDVQGYEMKVLEGGLKVLKHVDYVLVETSCKHLYEKQAFFHDVYSFFIEQGFEYEGNWDQLLSPLDQSILQVDALFVRKL